MLYSQIYKLSLKFYSRFISTFSMFSITFLVEYFDWDECGWMQSWEIIEIFFSSLPISLNNILQKGSVFLSTLYTFLQSIRFIQVSHFICTCISFTCVCILKNLHIFSTTVRLYTTILDFGLKKTPCFSTLSFSSNTCLPPTLLNSDLSN